MVNHRNEKFLNQVHSFNRVLNDIFENDDINYLIYKPKSDEYKYLKLINKILNEGIKKMRHDIMFLIFIKFFYIE